MGQSTQERFIELKSRASSNEILHEMKSHGHGPFSSHLKIRNYVFDKNTFSFESEGSSLTVDSCTWQISDSSMIMYDSLSWAFRNVSALFEDQLIALNGKLSRNSWDKVELDLVNFDLDMINPFVEESKVDIEGVLNGKASVKDPYGELLFESNLSFEKLVFNDKALGSGKVVSEWEDQLKILKVNGLISHKGEDKIDIDGIYDTKDEASPLKFRAKLNTLPLTVLEPLTRDVMSEFEGTASGDFQLTGHVSSPQLTGFLYLDHASALVDYTNVKYAFRNS